MVTLKQIAGSAGAGELPQAASYGLRQGVLSPIETLAQSVSTIAPTATPVATIPLVCALAGNGTRLALLLRFDGSPVSVRRHRRLELAARLCCHWIERDWRLLPLRKSIVARCDGPRRLRCPSGNFSYGNIRLDCLA